MNRLHVDDTLKSKLAELATRTELCDGDDHLLGYFVPATLSERTLYQRAKAEFSHDEIERRCRDRGGLTTAEVMQKLQALEDSQ